MIGEFFTTPGIGGGVVIFVMVLASTVYFLLTRWIIQGGEDNYD